MSLQEYRTITIRKVGDKWRVSRDNAAEPYQKDQKVAWTLVADDSVAVHFQFTDRELMAPTGLSRDLTAEIPPGPGPRELKLKIGSEFRRKNDVQPPPEVRRRYYYAVWVKEGNTGNFATGEDGNPPPELEIGP